MKEKKSKKGIIIALLILVIILAGVGGIVIFKNSNNSTGTDWGDYYLNNLEIDSTTFNGYNANKEKQYNDEYLLKDATNVEIQIISLKNQKNPAMLVFYEKDNRKRLIRYLKYDEPTTNGLGFTESFPLTYYDSDMLQQVIIDEEDKTNNYDVQLLYNIEEEQYSWYLYTEKENGDRRYWDYRMLDSSTFEYNNIDSIYEFTANEMRTNQTDENGNSILSKFEETFIVIEEKTSNYRVSIDNIKNIKVKDLVKYIKKAIAEQKDIEDIITEDIQIATQNKIEELETKREEIKQAEEEKAKKEAEEKAKAEEEARIKAEEEAKKKAEEEAQKTNNESRDIKFGIYKGTGGTTYNGAKLTINSNYTFTINYANGNSESGEWTYYGYEEIFFNGMGETGGDLFQIEGNNTLVHGDENVKFIWTGN